MGQPPKKSWKKWCHWTTDNMLQKGIGYLELPGVPSEILRPDAQQLRQQPRQAHAESSVESSRVDGSSGSVVRWSHAPRLLFCFFCDTASTLHGVFFAPVFFFLRCLFFLGAMICGPSVKQKGVFTMETQVLHKIPLNRVKNRYPKWLAPGSGNMD